MEIIRLTPPGRGAVASFLLCGKNAADIFSLHWHGKMPDELPTWGRLQLTDAGVCEEAVSHLTADGIEIHVHGGELITSAIESLFRQHGATCKTWQEHFTSGTSQQGITQQDLALRLLPFAPTERTAQILLDQYNGAWDREISHIAQLSDHAQRQERQARLQELALLGKHLVEPFRVVLAGASNAGKSSLLNTILGFQRSLVHSLPGTTRDVISGQTALDGFPVTFLDTAGFRETGDDLERQGIDRSFRSLADADLVLWVIDTTTEESQRPACPTESNLLICYNKIDLTGTPACHPIIHYSPSPSSVSVSALTGEGIETLLAAVLRHLVPHPPKPGEAVRLSPVSTGG